MCRLIVLFAVLTIQAMCADDVPSPPPVGTTPRPMSMALPRPNTAYEVEIVILRAGDTAGLATWTELAATGFHVVGTIPGDGQTTVLLERPIIGTPGSLRLPASVEANPSQAGLRQRILAAMQARQGQPQRAVPPPEEKR